MLFYLSFLYQSLESTSGLQDIFSFSGAYTILYQWMPRICILSSLSLERSFYFISLEVSFWGLANNHWTSPKIEIWKDYRSYCPGHSWDHFTYGPVDLIWSDSQSLPLELSFHSWSVIDPKVGSVELISIPSLSSLSFPFILHWSLAGIIQVLQAYVWIECLINDQWMKGIWK